MALEDLLSELIEAIKENTAALGGESKPAPKSTGTKAAGTKSTGTKGKTKKGPTLEDMTKIVGEYLTTGSAKEKKVAAANVGRMNDHFGVERISKVDEDQYEEVIAMVEAFKEGEDPLEDEGEEEDETSGLM